MAQQTIGIGTIANDGTGDPLRTAMDKANDNFTELYLVANPTPTAENDFSVAGAGLTWIKKTLAQVKTILGLGTAAYTAVTDYLTHALATATNDFIVASGSGVFVKKTLAETKTILGITTGDVMGPATNTADYIPQWNGANSKTLKDGVAVPAGGLAGLTAPTFTTNITTPLLIGGTDVGSKITYKSTTGIGTVTGIAHQFIGGTDGATTAMTILNNGNVGIGTTTPTQLLYVRKDQNMNTMMLFENQSTGALAQTNIRAINNLGSISQLGIYGGNATAYGTIGADTAYLYGNTATLNIMSDNANGVITFATGGNAEKVRINKSGNVGIGTTTPTTGKLVIVDTTLAGSAALAGSVLDLAQTWNTTGTPTALKLNVTNTASNAASLLMDLQVATVSQFSVSKAGAINALTSYSVAGTKVIGAQVASIGLDAKSDANKITDIIAALRAHGILGPNA